MQPCSRSVSDTTEKRPVFTLFLRGNRGKPAKEPACFCPGMVAESHGFLTQCAQELVVNQGGLMG
jgi:hypothetical protein